MIHPELESELFKQIRLIKDIDPLEPVTVMVGSRLLEQYFTGKLVKESNASFNIRFITFADLIRGLSFIFQDDRPKLPKIGKRAIISEVVGAVKWDNYFNNVQDRSGFQRSLAATFNDIDESGIEITNVNLTNQLPKSSKWSSLQQMFEMNSQIQNKFRNRTQEITKLKDIGQVFKNTFQSPDLFVFGFYDFTPGQFKIIKALSEKIKIRAFVPYWSPGDDFGNAFQYATPAHRHLLKLSKNEEQKLMPENGCENKGFGFRLFRYNPNESGGCLNPSGQRVRIIKGSDITDEISRIVGKINELVLYMNVPIEKIGILLWHPELYRSGVCSALEGAGLPFYDAIGTSLIDTREGRTTDALLKLIGHRLKRRDIVDLLATFELNLTDQDEGIAPDLVVWEKLSNLTSLIAGSRQDWNKTLDRFEYHSDDVLFRTQAGLFRGFINKLFDFIEQCPTSGSYREISLNLREYLREFIPTSDIKSQIISILDELCELDEISEEITKQAFIDLFRESMMSASNKIGQFGSGVTVFDKMTGRGVAFDVLFMPGLVQGAVPISAREDPILPDSVRKLIKVKVGNKNPFCLPLKKHRSREERLLFTLAVDSARKQLFLTFPGSDFEGGKPNLPSSFLLEICRSIFGRPISSEKLTELPILEKPDDLSTDGKRSFSHRLTSPEGFISQWIATHVPRNLRHQAVRQVYSGQFSAYDHNRRAYLARRDQTTYSEWDGISLQLKSTDKNNNFEFPVTDLEGYAKCPFRYWIEKVLNIAPLEEPEMVVEIPPHVTGSIIHKVLEDVYENTYVGRGKADESCNIENIQEFARTSLYNEVDRWVGRCPAPQVIWDMTVFRLQTRLKNFLRTDMEDMEFYKVKSTERRISGNLIFGTGSTEFSVKIKGSIDRIDESSDCRLIRIVDYKTGRAPTKPDQFKGGRRLQLPLYLKAMFQESPDYDRENSTAEYIQIKSNGDKKHYGITGQVLIDRDEDLKNILETITEGISDNYYPPIPEDSNCPICPVSPACNRFSRSKYFNVTNDPRIERMISLREIY